MKIYGIGTDIVEIDRIKINKEQKFVKRLFDPQEIIKCLKVKNSSTVLQRFAAKEAFSKALEQVYQKALVTMKLLYSIKKIENHTLNFYVKLHCL